MIPSACVALVAVPTVYIIFTRKGLSDRQDSKIAISEKINQTIADIGNFLKMRKNSCVEELNDNFYGCDWKQWIKSSCEQIDIVVYYFDTWLKQNKQELIAFLKRSDTRINLIVCDPDKEENIKYIHSLFPENSEGYLKEKIHKTYKLLASIAEEAGAKKERIKFYCSERPLTYSIQRFDNKKAALSVFEMFRQDRIGSPMMLIDLSDSRKISQFLEKEIGGLIEVSREHKS